MGGKHYSQETKDKIIELRMDGLCYPDIAEMLSVGMGVVQQTCEKSGITVRDIKRTLQGHPNKQRNEELYQRISELRDKGHSVGKIASMLGINRGTVSGICQRIGKAPTEEEREKAKQKHTDVASFIANISDGIEYVCGYKSKRVPLTVRCKTCGNTFDITLHRIKYENPRCPHCTEAERQKREQEKAVLKAERELAKEEAKRKRIEREAELERKRQERIHDCPVCGTSTDRPKYCSDECAKKNANAMHDAKRRIKIESAMIDKDITLPSLFKRDGGVCHICGDQCRWEDFITVEGQKITGDWYPSIDHVVPLSKGGKHSWKNVKLAHRWCNTVKRDKPLTDILL